MAQTTGSVAQSNFKIEVSTNGSSWTDISGQSNTVETDGGEHQTGEQYTADGDVPVVTYSNKVSSTTVKCSILYTETSGEAFAVIYARYIGTDKTIYLRYAPKGGTTANKRYVASNAANTAIAVPIITCNPPNGDASSGDPLMFEFSVMAPRLYQEAIP